MFAAAPGPCRLTLSLAGQAESRTQLPEARARQGRRVGQLQFALDKLEELLQLEVQGEGVSVVGDDPVEGHAVVQPTLGFRVVDAWKEEGEESLSRSQAAGFARWTLASI